MTSPKKAPLPAKSFWTNFRAEPLLAAYACLIVFSLLGSLAGRFSHVTPGMIRPVVSLLISVVATVGLGQIWIRAVGFRSAFWTLLSVLVLGGAVEVFGLSTGIPFGRYIYTDSWWPTIALGKAGLFPVLLPFAWLMMATGSYVAGQRIMPGWWGVFFGGFVAALADAPMEPIMVRVLHYWRWIQPGELFGAPATNFIAWWGTAVAAGVILKVSDKNLVSAKPIWYLAGHLLLCGGLGLIGGILSPGIALIVVGVCLAFLTKVTPLGDQSVPV